MVLLSTLLGPAKPPVASEDDVASAGGLYHVVEFGGSLIAEPVIGEGEHITIAEGERCLVCLSEYEAGEEIRQLGQCKHIYHRLCIDEVCITIDVRIRNTNPRSGLPQVAIHVRCVEDKEFPTPAIGRPLLLHDIDSFWLFFSHVLNSTNFSITPTLVHCGRYIPAFKSQALEPDVSFSLTRLQGCTLKGVHDR